MVRKGYVEQQIADLGLFLAGLFRVKSEGNYDTVLTELRGGCKRLTGLEIDTVAGLPEPMLLTMLGGGMNVRDFLEVGKCITLAALLRERAGLYRLESKDNAALSAERRALMLYCEALIAEPSVRTVARREEVDLLAAALRAENGGLPSPALHRMFRYYEAIGAFGKAEDALYALRESPAAPPPGLHKESVEFYVRLLKLPDDALIAGGLPRDEVEDALAELA